MFETCCIPQQLLLVSEGLTQKIKQQSLRSFARVGKAIIDTVAVAPVGDYPGILKVRQMTRNIRLRIFQDVLDIADAQLAVKQQIDDPQAIVVTKCFEILFQIQIGRASCRERVLRLV